MTCREMQQDMMAYVVNELSRERRHAFEAHLARCASCAQTLAEIAAVWETLEVSTEDPVPEKTERVILGYARDSLRMTDEAPLVSFRTTLAVIKKSLAPVFMGLLTTTVFAVILWIRTDLDLIHPLGLTVAGALWTGLFALVFYLFYLGSRQKTPSWRFLAQASLTAIGIFLLLTFINPLPSSVRFCSNYRLTQPLIERLSIGGAYFLFGSLYALIPMGIAAYLSAGRQKNNPLLRGSLAGGMFMLLLTPGIFLQCAPFALGVVLGWFGGALVGSVLGGAIGYWIRYRVARN